VCRDHGGASLFAVQQVCCLWLVWRRRLPRTLSL
jgi:hypothetical protein